MNVSPFQERARNYRSIYAVAEVLKMVSSGASDEARSLIHTRHYWRVKRLQDAGYMRAERVSIHTRHYWRVWIETEKLRRPLRTHRGFTRQ